MQTKSTGLRPMTITRRFMPGTHDTFRRSHWHRWSNRLKSEEVSQVHRSAIVNVDWICEVRKEKRETLLVLKNGTRIRVSRRRRARVSRCFVSQRLATQNRMVLHGVERVSDHLTFENR